MKKKNRSYGPFDNTMSAAGWLFADLLLALVMVFLVTNTSNLETTSTPRNPSSLSRIPFKTSFKVNFDTLIGKESTLVCPTTIVLLPLPTTAVPTPLPTPGAPTAAIPTPTPTPACTTRESMERVRVRSLIRNKLGIFNGRRRAGIVLTYSNAPLLQIDESIQVAKTIDELLVEELPSIFQRTALKPFHTVNEDLNERGDIVLEIYWIVDNP